VVVAGLTFVPLPVTAILFKVILAALFTFQDNWLDCPGVITAGEAVKAEITGAVGIAVAGVFWLDPLPLQADRTKMKSTRIIGRKDL
jgi:hypothetical protein